MFLAKLLSPFRRQKGDPQILIPHYENNPNLTDEEQVQNIWEQVRNPKLEFNIYQIATNMSVVDSSLFNQGFMEFLRFYGFRFTPTREDTFITSGKKTGKYSINFSNIDLKNDINKVSLSEWLVKSPYYPKTTIVHDSNDLNRLKVNENQKYYIKPIKGNGCKNIGISLGKNIEVCPESVEKFPLVFQESVRNIRLHKGCKEDERIFVLYLKTEDKIRTFLFDKSIVRRCKQKYTEEIKATNHFTIQVNNNHLIEKAFKDPCEVNALVPLINDVNRRMLINFSHSLKRNHQVEFWLTGWDIIFDDKDKPWLIEVNPSPNQCENIKARTWNYAIYQEILEMIVAIEQNKPIIEKNFVEVSQI